jgi:hypothetical protein
MKPADEVLYDSEASLRLVDRAITELSASGTELDGDSRAFLQHVMSQPGGFSELSKSLLRAYAETLGIVARIQGAAESPEQAEFDRLSQVNGNLREVTSATEVAASDILDGLGRAIAVVERLDTDGSDADRRRELVASLREELYDVVAHLQFQDIMAQRLNHVSTLLGQMRRRLLEMLTVFTPAGVVAAELESLTVFETTASMLNTAERQAVVEETLARTSVRKTA